MKSEELRLSDNQDKVLILKAQIKGLQEELRAVEQKTVTFENILRTELGSMLIEVQELTVLYKQQKQAKKTKRQEQKKRGKNYKAPVGLKSISQQPEIQSQKVEDKEMKRLYREAMLHVHPDKFSMQEEKMDLATEVTTRLIDIYQSGDLKALASYHRYIFSGNALEGVEHETVSGDMLGPKDDYLEKEIERLEQELADAKKQQTYKVLTEYDDPLTFLEELRVYYRDRIAKLRRRTRT
ncbi:MAG: hypothetical protein HEP71_10930 [Roseivirga sp.]|nr:hypothetical protein [Roseivirga sp.]